MNSTQQARRLRREQTKEEKQLWRALRAGRFAGFKFRRQHPLGPYLLDFYCPSARVSVELDGSGHGYPDKWERDQRRERFLAARGIQELRYWNHQWRRNREGILMEIWYALHKGSGCVEIARMEANHRFVPPHPEQLGEMPLKPPMKYPWDLGKGPTKRTSSP